MIVFSRLYYELCHFFASAGWTCRDEVMITMVMVKYEWMMSSVRVYYMTNCVLGVNVCDV